MSQNRYTVFPVVLVYGGPTTLNVRQLNKVSAKSGSKKDVIIPGGNIDPSAIMLLGADPIVSITSEDIATLLTAISLTAGLECNGGSNLVQYQQRADGGTFSGGSTNVVLTNTKGFIYPKRLTVSQDKPAELELELMCLWDGTTTGSPALPLPPLQFATGQALTSTPTFVGRYYLGPVYINAVQIQGVQEMEIDFGIECQAKKADGDVYPQVCSIVSRKPKLTFKGQTMDAAPTNMFNKALPGAAAFYLRAGAAGGARTSDATAAHIKISAATGAYSTDELDAQGQEDGTLSVPIDATGVLTANLATAIP